MSRIITLSFICMVVSLAAKAQMPGDTIEIRSWNYGQTTGSGNRDTVIDFPDLQGIQFEKILMLYNMRCKGGLVSPPVSGQTNIGCGEWDYSCNTYVVDSSRADSIYLNTPKYVISEFTGNTFKYKATPLYDYFRQIQKTVTVNSTVSEQQHPLGNGNINIAHALATSRYASKAQYLFTAAELTAAGVVAGNIDALILEATNNPSATNFLQVRIKNTTKTALDASDPDLSGFTQVYYSSPALATGNNRLQFYTPFSWNGTGNIIVELSYTNASDAANTQIKGIATTNTSAIAASGEYYFHFNGSNYIEADQYKGVSGNTARSVEAWIKTTVNDKEICSWGVDQAGKKWVFRLDNTGKLRVETNGGSVVGTAVLSDGAWHHVAFTFQGNDLTGLKFYVDGQPDANSATTNLAVNTDATNGIPVRISRGINNRYFTGEIDDIRIWEAALSQASIQEWMHRKVNNTHPDYANLKLYYLLDEGNGISISDLSGNNNDASVVNGAVWTKAIGQQLFKSFVEASERPNTTFVQGTYNTTITNNPVDLQVEQTPHVVIERSVTSNSGITSDVITSGMPVIYWNAATGERYYDENEALINTVPVSPYDSLVQTNLNYWSRSPMTFEIMSFVTPYGVNLDLGPNGKTWTFDVTDFTPILKGSKRMVMKAGGQWQEDMDVRFLFIVGTPPKDVLDISQIWKTDRGSTTGANIQNESAFPPRDVLFMNNAGSFKIRSSITGHGQQGEFVAQTHYINLNGGNNEFSWQAWKKCAENPVYPQGGTWIYDRAGWCPGMATDIKEMDITQYVTPGQTHTIDYGISSNPSGDSRYIISNQLVSYGPANHALDARILDIQRPTGKVEHARLNPMCYAPQVVIQNTGSTALTSATIEYWVNNATQKETFNWTGNLALMETAVIDLPVTATLWNSIAGATGNKFHAKVKNPNGGADEYTLNDEQYAVFNITDVVPRKFVVKYTSNRRPAETKIKILDASGNTVYTNTLTASEATSNDTVSLGLGCFSLLVTDSGNDGIDFFANNDGVGALSLNKVEDGAVIKQLEPDFGKSLQYNFTVGFPLSFEELENSNSLKVYPNPAANELTVELNNGNISRIEMVNMLGQKMQVPVRFISGKKAIINTSLMSSGIYSLQTESNGKTAVQKVVIQH